MKLEFVPVNIENYKLTELDDAIQEEGRLYRCYHTRRVGFCGWTKCILWCESYKIQRYTPCGFVILDANRSSREIWVSAHTDKRFAYPTIKQALNSYILRKKKEIKILDQRKEASTLGLQKARKVYNSLEGNDECNQKRTA